MGKRLPVNGLNTALSISTEKECMNEDRESRLPIWIA